VAGESAQEAARRQREKAERLLRSAELHERGADGEKRTEAVLSRLPPDQWTVLHDRRWPGRKVANIDHVVVGPPGVFVVDSKNWSGRITIRDGVLRQNGYTRESTLRAAADAALAVADLSHSVPPAHFRPVVCFAREEGLSGSAGDVLVCSTSNLIQRLSSAPPVLTPEEVRYASLELDAVLEHASDPPTTDHRGPVRRAPSPHPAPPTPPSTQPPSTQPSTTPTSEPQPVTAGPWARRRVVILALLALLLAPLIVAGFGQAVAALLVR
jgi:hypothetical protein